MIDAKIKKIRLRNEELTKELSRPEILSDQNRYRKLAKEQSELYQVISYFDKLDALIIPA
jgi:peptide chain release factor 1